MRIVLVFGAVLAGCATQPGDAPDVRGSWKGATYDEVVSQWGTPVRNSKLSDGRDVYVWRSEASSRNIVAYPATGSGMGTGPAPVGTDVIFQNMGGGDRSLCERTLIFKDGRVEEQTWRGSADYCGGFARGAEPRP